MHAWRILHPHLNSSAGAAEWCNALHRLLLLPMGTKAKAATATAIPAAAAAAALAAPAAAAAAAAPAAAAAVVAPAPAKRATTKIISVKAKSNVFTTLYHTLPHFTTLYRTLPHFTALNQDYSGWQMLQKF